MKQYYGIKEEYKDCILFFRMGDFYELFGKDAIVAAKILGITLTKRNNGQDGDNELCGFPYHAAERYVPKMVNAGFKVAICEQVEDPKLAKGIVKREVIEVITAGTTLSEQTLQEKENNYLVAIYPNGSSNFALSGLDISTGDFFYLCGDFDSVECELFRIQARELLYPSNLLASHPEALNSLKAYENLVLSPLEPSRFEAAHAQKILQQQLATQSLEIFGLQEKSAELSVCGAILDYALDQKKTALEHLKLLYRRDLNDFMTLDPHTLRNLELVEPMNASDKSSTLLNVLDYTVTSMGGRMLRQWITQPLLQKEAILQRQETVRFFTENLQLRENLRREMRGINDLERLMARLCSGRINPKELQAVGFSLQKTCQCASLVENQNFEYFQKLNDLTPGITEKADKILEFLTDEPPLTVREGKMIRPGVSQKLDALNEGIREAREWLANLESAQKEQTGIGSLKVGYNKVFGYYLEVPRSQSDKIPDSYIRKQTLANAERFITPDMKEYESLILNAEGEINALEYEIFCELRDEVKSWYSEILEIAQSLSCIDSLNSLAHAAVAENYTCPEFSDDDALEIVDGFHPVIVHNNPDLTFIHNDCHLHCQSCRMMLITGPNMAGKSTYLRQTGLIVLLFQIGSFVPASHAKLSVHDRIFTRVGASDRLAKGQSTFMVEMVETANILHNATPKSLILLDEIGRGTSTFDGLSLAWALVENIHNNPNIAAKTLFATHYHELTTLVDSLQHGRNYHVTVQDNEGHLIFLRKIVQGASDSSYGIQVAQMAGLPTPVIARATEILMELEQKGESHSLPKVAETASPYQQTDQTDLFGIVKINKNHEKVFNKIESIDPNEMSPLQALQFLFQLKKKFY